MRIDAVSRRWVAHAFAAIAIATMVIALVHAEARVGVTVDEHGHLVRGLAIWWAPDTRLNWPHPPLPHALIALPTILSTTRVDLTALAGWDDADFTRVVKAYWELVGYDVALSRCAGSRSGGCPTLGSTGRIRRYRTHCSRCPPCCRRRAST